MSETADFGLPVVPSTSLLGIFMAIQAMADAINLTHIPVGCKPKIMNLMVAHNAFERNFHRNRWTNFGEEHLVHGSEERLARFIGECCRRYDRPRLMVVTTNTVMEMTGADIAGLLGRVAPMMPGTTLVHVAADDLGGDIWSGFGRLARALLPHLTGSRDRRPGFPALNLLGYCPDRIEGEHTANIAEMARLAQALGVELQATLFSPRPFAALAEAAAQAQADLLLPHLGLSPAQTQRLTGRPAFPVPLPLAPGPTRRWLSQVAEAGGVDPARAAGVADREEEELAPVLRVVRERLGGLRVAVFADTINAAGLTLLLTDLKLQVTLVGLTDRTLGGRDRFASLLAEEGMVPGGIELLADPTVQQLAGIERQQPLPGFDLIIRPTLQFYPGTVPVVELGFPACHEHALVPLPTLGYRGAAALCQRLLSAAMRPRVEGRRLPPRPLAGEHP